MRLSEEQVRLLIGWKFPQDVRDRNRAMRDITNEGTGEMFFDNHVEVRYSLEEGTFYAMLDQQDKLLLDARLNELTPERSQNQQIKANNFEKKQGRTKVNDYERE